MELETFYRDNKSNCEFKIKAYKYRVLQTSTVAIFFKIVQLLFLLFEFTLIRFDLAPIVWNSNLSDFLCGNSYIKLFMIFVLGLYFLLFYFGMKDSVFLGTATNTTIVIYELTKLLFPVMIVLAFGLLSSIIVNMYHILADEITISALSSCSFFVNFFTTQIPVFSHVLKAYLDYNIHPFLAFFFTCRVFFELIPSNCCMKSLALYHISAHLVTFVFLPTILQHWHLFPLAYAIAELGFHCYQVVIFRSERKEHTQ